MAVGVLIEALLGGPAVSTVPATSGNTSAGGAKEWIKNKLKALSQLLGKLEDKTMTALPGIIGSIISWILKWLISELVGTYNRCWSFDLHIYYDENEKKMNHLNTHHTVKIDVIPYIKATCSSS